MTYDRKGPAHGRRAGNKPWRSRIEGSVAAVAVQGAAPAPVVPAVNASKNARELARKRGIDLSKIRGTGPGGRIDVLDVRRFSGGV